MGSSRSGRWRDHRKKELIEDALSVDVRELIGTGSALWSGNGTVAVRNYAGRIVGQPDARLIPLEDGSQALAFTIEFDSTPVWQVIPVLRPTENNGRRETMLACPNERCGAACRKLHLPPGRKTFLCRSCHGLTYRSQQEHDPRISRLKRNPDRLVELLDKTDFEKIPLPKFLLLMKACRACIRDLQTQLPNEVVEAVNAAFLAVELVRDDG